MGETFDQSEDLPITQEYDNQPVGDDKTDNIYIDTKNRATALVTATPDCVFVDEGSQMTTQGVCDHYASDVGLREQAETFIRIRGKSVYEGLNIKVIDPESGYEMVIYTTCLEGGCPEGVTQMDRKVQLGDIELVPSQGIAAYIEAKKEMPDKVSVFVLKGEGELEVKVGGDIIGKIVSPGLIEPVSIHTGQIDLQSEFINSLATITPDGKVVLNTEAITTMDNLEGFEEETQNTLIQNDKRGDSCNLNSLLSNTGSLDPTESLLVLIALMTIFKKLNK